MADNTTFGGELAKGFGKTLPGLVIFVIFIIFSFIALNKLLSSPFVKYALIGVAIIAVLKVMRGR